ncbi:MAG: hypothetical protein AAF922_04245 [Pseudomonadota bacterium]
MIQSVFAIGLSLARVTIARILVAPFAIVWVAMAWVSMACADTGHPKFTLDGNRLIYDTVNVPEDVVDDIEDEDVTVLRALLQTNPGIEVLELNSEGGSLWASHDIADIVIDFEIATHVNGECSSSCPRIFLAGFVRTMSRGSRIGFHQTGWSPRNVRSYYESEAEYEGWADPFEYGSWIYQDTQAEMHESLLYMVRRGVDPLFAIETLKSPPGSMWYPYRARLLAAGVLTE